MSEPILCPKCNQLLVVGSWPYCPHGFGTYTAVGDDIPGGMVMENLCPGRKVYSKTELKRVLAERGWQLSESRADTPGIDPHVSRQY